MARRQRTQSTSSASSCPKAARRLNAAELPARRRAAGAPWRAHCAAQRRGAGDLRGAGRSDEARRGARSPRSASVRAIACSFSCADTVEFAATCRRGAHRRRGGSAQQQALPRLKPDMSCTTARRGLVIVEDGFADARPGLTAELCSRRPPCVELARALWQVKRGARFRCHCPSRPHSAYTHRARTGPPKRHRAFAQGIPFAWPGLPGDRHRRG